MSDSPLTWALAYAARGWHVFPCKADKKPLTEHGFHDASADAATIEAWWQRWQFARVGVACGASGLVVIDLDKKNDADGVAAFEALAGAEPHGAALVQRTPSGGLHYVYAACGSHKNSQSKIAAGIDVRGFDGYFIAQSGDDGREWIEGDPLEDEPTPPPEWVRKLLDSTIVVDSSGEPSTKAIAAGDWAGVGEGRRNATLAQLTGKVALHLGHEAAKGLMSHWARAVGLPADEASKTIESILAKDAREHGIRGNADDVADFEGITEVARAKRLRAMPVALAWDLAADTSVQDWLIEDWLCEQSLALLAGASKCGKSFLSVDLAFRMAYGLDWHGHRLKPGSVAYFCGEGTAGLRKRVRAWLAQNDVRKPDDRYFGFFDGVPPLTKPEGRAIVEDTIGALVDRFGHAPQLVVIDTLSQAFGDGDENDAKTVGPALAAAEIVKKQYGTTVLCIHHLAKHVKPGEMSMDSVRGSGAFHGNVDAVLGLARDGNVRVLKQLANRDADDSGDVRFVFDLLPVETGIVLPSGKPEVSCVIRPIDAQQTLAMVQDAEGAKREKRQGELAADVELVVAAVARLGTATKVDAIAKAAGIRSNRGRAAVDVATSLGRIENTGSRTRPVYVVPAGVVCVQSKQRDVVGRRPGRRPEPGRRTGTTRPRRAARPSQEPPRRRGREGGLTRAVTNLRAPAWRPFPADRCGRRRSAGLSHPHLFATFGQARAAQPAWESLPARRFPRGLAVSLSD